MMPGMILSIAGRSIRSEYVRSLLFAKGRAGVFVRVSGAYPVRGSDAAQ